MTSSSRSRRFLRSPILGIGTLQALGAVLALGAGLHHREWTVFRSRATPPEQVSDLSSFLLHMPRPSAAFELIDGERRFIELFGEPVAERSRLVLPSGPPAYVFDESLQLVDWTADQGDDSGYQDQWYGMTRRLLGEDEAESLLTAHSEAVRGRKR